MRRRSSGVRRPSMYIPTAYTFADAVIDNPHRPRREIPGILARANGITRRRRPLRMHLDNPYRTATS